MKKGKSILIVLLMVIAFSACKKEYHCAATLNGIVEDKHCEKCSKSEADDFKKSLEAAGYTNVSCEKE